MHVFGLQEQIRLLKHNRSCAVNSLGASTAVLIHNTSSSPQFCIYCIWMSYTNISIFVLEQLRPRVTRKSLPHNQLNLQNAFKYRVSPSHSGFVAGSGAEQKWSALTLKAAFWSFSEGLGVGPLGEVVIFTETAQREMNLETHSGPDQKVEFTEVLLCLRLKLLGLDFFFKTAWKPYCTTLFLVSKGLMISWWATALQSWR